MKLSLAGVYLPLSSGEAWCSSMHLSKLWQTSESKEIGSSESLLYMVTAIWAGCGTGKGMTILSGEYGRYWRFHGNQSVDLALRNELIGVVDSLRFKTFRFSYKCYFQSCYGLLLFLIGFLASRWLFISRVKRWHFQVWWMDLNVSSRRVNITK